MPYPAIILICIGCALIVGGLVYVVVALVRLIKAGRRVGITSMNDMQVVVRKVQGLEPRFQELERNQAALAASMQRLNDEAAKLSCLKEELDKATGYMSSVKKHKGPRFSENCETLYALLLEEQALDRPPETDL